LCQGFAQDRVGVYTVRSFTLPATSVEDPLERLESGHV
jgi:hypothetical protein